MGMKQGLAGLLLGAALVFGCGSKELIPAKRYSSFDVRYENLIYNDSAPKKALFEEAYREADLNWDNFQEQFSFIRVVTLTDTIISAEGNRSIGAQINYPDSLTIRDQLDFYLIHECAHIWYANIKNKEEFEKRWKLISGNSYFGEEWKKARLPDMERIGAGYLYGTKNFEDDIAETSKLVYMAKVCE